MNKKTVKTSLMITACCFFLTISLAGQATASWLTSYYQNHPTTSEQLEASYGQPVSIIQNTDDTEKRIYGPKDVMVGYTFFILKDNLVIDKGVTDTLGQMPKAAINPEASGHMASYYNANPLSADDLKRKMGSPVETCSYDNGTQKLFYGPKDVVTGYTYYLIKDGMVVDKNTSDRLENNNVAKIKAPEPKGHMADHFAANPMTIAELKAKWGDHLSNHDYDNGIKKLTFGPKDSVVGYTYFLVKDGIVVDKNFTDSI